jgi:hypothetical protein
VNFPQNISAKWVDAEVAENSLIREKVLHRGLDNFWAIKKPVTLLNKRPLTLLVKRPVTLFMTRCFLFLARPGVTGRLTGGG